MGTAMIDTLAYSKKLQAVGVSPEVAEAHATVFAEIIQDRLVTRDDLQLTKNELTQEISDLRKEMHQEIRSVRSDMHSVEERLNHRIDNVTHQLTIRLGSLMAVGIAILATLHKFVG